MLAGLEHAAGDAVVVIDSDLQHPPTAIPAMVQRWRDGAHVVEAVKRNRTGQGVLGRLGGTAVQPGVHRHDQGGPGRRHRLPAAQPPGAGRAAAAARALLVLPRHEQLDRLPAQHDRGRHRPPGGRRVPVDVPVAVPARGQRAHLVHLGTAAPGHRGRPGLRRVLGGARRADADPLDARRLGGRLPDGDPAAAGDGHLRPARPGRDRRVPGPHPRGGPRPAALPGPGAVRARRGAFGFFGTAGPVRAFVPVRGLRPSVPEASVPEQWVVEQRADQAERS